MLLSLLPAQAAVADIPADESLNYRVMFKWGLVNKRAGTVNLSTHANPAAMTFDARLTARSDKWADRFYQVRDTLCGRMLKSTVEPIFYEKITHEGDVYKHDRIDYRRQGDNVSATCRRISRDKPDAPLDDSTISLDAEGLTLDMLSSFYFMRRLDYNAMKPGESTTLTVFSGKRKETLTITYSGIESVSVDGNNIRAYAIRFRFTGKGGKKTSDDMLAWISCSDSRIPLKLVGKLPVGRVECYYIPPE